MRKIPFAGIELTSQRVRQYLPFLRQKKRDAEEADKVEVSPGVTVASLRRFRTALIGPSKVLSSIIKNVPQPNKRFDNFSPIPGGCSEGLGVF